MVCKCLKSKLFLADVVYVGVLLHICTYVVFLFLYHLSNSDLPVSQVDVALRLAQEFASRLQSGKSGEE